jgi:hypothetical protein
MVTARNSVGVNFAEVEGDFFWDKKASFYNMLDNLSLYNDSGTWIRIYES